MTLLWLLLPFLALPSYGFDKQFCEFHSPNYSLEWAYEPSSKTVVFVLKVNSTEPRYWTGVGFSGKKGPTDFVGVLVRDKHVVLADAYLNNSGVLYTDMLGNVQTIGYDYDGQHLVAKFARPILSDDVKDDQQLDECITFLMPTKAGEILAQGIKPDLNTFNRVHVCSIQEHCAVNVVLNKVNNKEKEDVRFAKSVDISGTGDPCSFEGHDYTIDWTFNKTSDAINFVYRFPSKKGKYWSAVGIGDNMSDMDIVTIFLENGDVKKLGDYFSSGYRTPEEDETQDWKLESSKQVDSAVEVHFSRKVVTEDSEKDRPLDDCVLFQFGVNLGRYGDEFQMHKHDGWPDLYKACNLRESCEAVSLQKRAKNKKKGQKKQEETEETTLSVGENNDEASTTASNDKPEATTVQKEESKDVVEGSGQDLEGSGQESEPTTEKVETTTVKLEETTAKKEETTTSETTTMKAEETTVKPEEATKAPEAETEKEETTQKVETTTEAEAKTTKPESAKKPKTEETQKLEEKSEKVNDKCDAQKPDLAVCEGYMNNYLEQVKEWAQRHEEQMDNQYGKACALLSAVPHVPTLCCHIFQKVCADQIS